MTGRVPKTTYWSAGVPVSLRFIPGVDGHPRDHEGEERKSRRKSVLDRIQRVRQDDDGGGRS